MLNSNASADVRPFCVTEGRLTKVSLNKLVTTWLEKPPTACSAAPAMQKIITLHTISG